MNLLIKRFLLSVLIVLVINFLPILITIPLAFFFLRVVDLKRYFPNKEIEIKKEGFLTKCKVCNATGTVFSGNNQIECERCNGTSQTYVRCDYGICSENATVYIKRKGLLRGWNTLKCLEHYYNGNFFKSILEGFPE